MHSLTLKLQKLQLTESKKRDQDFSNLSKKLLE